MAKTALPFNNESEKTVIGSMIASKKIYNDALSLLEEDKSYIKIVHGAGYIFEVE